MTETSVQLEASRAGGGGARLPLDLTTCPSYAFFPGQLVVLTGRNPEGARIHVSGQRSVPTGSIAPVRMLPDASAFGDRPVSLLVAAGPYSLNTGALDFSPLDRLLLLALERQPDLLVLVNSLWPSIT